MEDIRKLYKKESIDSVKTSKSIVDPRVFDLDYIPEKPYVRPEVKSIMKACLRHQNTGVPSNLIVFGSRGSGKTLLVRYITEELLAKDYGTQVFYANCMEFNTSTKILAHWLNTTPRTTVKAAILAIDWPSEVSNHRPGNRHRAHWRA